MTFDCHYELIASDTENLSMSVSSDNMRPDREARVVIWDNTDGEERILMAALTLDEMDELAARWNSWRAAHPKAVS